MTKKFDVEDNAKLNNTSLVEKLKIKYQQKKVRTTEIRYKKEIEKFIQEQMDS